MVKLSEDFIFRLKSICDITSIVSNYVELKDSGRTKKCCCPFHSEKTPSFVVFEDTQSFYCFGCSVGGDVISFIEKIENLDYLESVKYLAKYVGLELPSENFQYENSKKKERMLNINKEAARYYFNNMRDPKNKKILAYLAKKRFLKKSTIVKFGLGLALSGWDNLKRYLKGKGFSYDEMLEADLLLKSKNGNYYDKFRNRLMFPIIDLKGDVVGFGGRVLNEKDSPKYINSADSLVFKKKLGLFGLNFAKNSAFDGFVLCEGYMDVVSLFQCGFNMAVASLGTAISKEQVRLLCRYRKNIFLAYDMDSAGRMASNRAVSLFNEVGVTPKILNLNGAKDPDEYINKFGSASFKLAINNSYSAEKLKLKSIVEKYKVADLDEKKRYIDEYCVMLADIKDPVKRDVYMSGFCSSLKIDKYIILNYVGYLIKKKNKISRKKYDNSVVANIIKNRKENGGVPNKFIVAQEGIVRYLYYNPDSFLEIKSIIDEKYFNVIWCKIVYNFLVKLIISKEYVDIAAFHEVLDGNGMSRLCRILNNNIYSNSLDEVKYFINILRIEYEKKAEDISTMTLEEMEKARRKKAELKR